MKGIYFILVFLCFFMPSCSLKPIKPENGKALIDTRKLFTNEQLFGDKLWAVGEIISVINATNAKSIESDLLGNMQVSPGKYIIKYYCYVDGDRTIDSIYKRFRSPTSIDEIYLKDGDTLYVNSYLKKNALSAPNGRFLGYVPTCTKKLKKKNINDKEKVVKRKYL